MFETAMEIAGGAESHLNTAQGWTTGPAWHPRCQWFFVPLKAASALAHCSIIRPSRCDG